MDYIEDWVPVFCEFRRVLKDDGMFIFSVGQPFIDNFLKESVIDYFAIELVKMRWKTWGVQVLMPSYRRPLEAITSLLYEAGFFIEQILEARPTAEYKEADPKGYEKVSKWPSFLY